MASLDGSLSVVRARRRPTRYSPELVSSAPQQQHQHQQQQQQPSDMCISALLSASSDGVTATQLQDLQHDQEDNDEQNESEMAPGGKRPKQKPKRRYKKRQTLEDGTTISPPKKQRVANVLLENEMLIDEIRERKALWMRTHDQHHSSVLTAPLWDEIAKVLDTTQDSIKRRWKSLKDHYRRELKKTMLDATAPPSTWPYYRQMRFMKSQMFVSLRRKNGEDHLEILSDDEDIHSQWNIQQARKQEGGSDTMDDYELSEEYNEMVKYEQHMIQQMTHDNMDRTQEEEEDEEDDQHQQQQQDEDEQEEQGQEELSPIPSLQDQDELNALQQQAELSDLSDMSSMQQQPVMTTEMSTMTTIAEMVGITAIATTNSNSLSDRLPRMPQCASDIQRSNCLASIQQPREMNGDLVDMNARHSALQQHRAEINGRLSVMQRNADMSAIQRRADVTAMHDRAELTVMRQRAEMQRRNGEVIDISSIIADDRGGISDDYHFFMSLMPHVRHFTSLQKLKVRNRIQQIIIEEASNCQYDPLENC